MVIPKKTLAILLIVGLIAGILLYSQVGAVDGTPSAQITVIIREADGDGAIAGQVNTELTRSQSIFGHTVPMTTYIADIRGVEPNQPYEMEFIVTFQGDLPADAPKGLSMHSDATMIGERAGTQWFMTPTIPDPHIEISDIPMTANYTGTAEFTKTNGIYWDHLVLYDGSNSQQILGMYIDGSEWTCEITTSSGYAGTDAYWGTTTVTIILNVDETGNVNITVTDVDMVATEA